MFSCLDSVDEAANTRLPNTILEFNPSPLLSSLIHNHTLIYSKKNTQICIRLIEFHQSLVEPGFYGKKLSRVYQMHLEIGLCRIDLDCWLPHPSRQLTDEEIASRVVINNILNAPSIETKNPKIAFMFLSPGSLPFERLWDKFFQGHEGKFSIHIHASRVKPVHSSRYFQNREIRSDKVDWGKISMVDAEKRLLANALKDPDNQHFVLLSDSCVPLRGFDYVNNYLLYTNVSFIDSFEDPGPHGSGRYSNHMLPEVEKKFFRKGAQWFTMKRQHMPLLLWLIVSTIQSSEIIVGTKMASKILISESVHVTSDEKRNMTITPCMWNDVNRPCYLFARKFLPETLEKMIDLFPSYTTV
ncbi:hypothetical protein L2E82_49458 [Cichorium intybus]|uniref:Uncharacterized protein n=1 Tax=Cichorium intybus TaxID=13427 RepID=A0ACB8Z4S8_CICIN|nr:hypothetical protein L2E82_49458 [Cichorium intybus]